MRKKIQSSAILIVLLTSFIAAATLLSAPANAADCVGGAPCPPIGDEPKDASKSTPRERPIDLLPTPKPEADARAKKKGASLRWNVQNMTKYRADAQLYSQDRNWVWPKAGKVYIFPDKQKYTFNISCKRNEKICFGGWIHGDTNAYWGVGYKNSHSCKRCCFICGEGQSQLIRLRP